jgi:hypothetical protein
MFCFYGGYINETCGKDIEKILEQTVGTLSYLLNIYMYIWITPLLIVTFSCLSVEDKVTGLIQCGPNPCGQVPDGDVSKKVHSGRTRGDRAV